ncbi:MAG: hypothetical protein A2104_02250 [Candidatus Melainabacteria bacterium GWF2_32_7]|nr:MAG: hypothetical protein A2104_02250 [Candidatus Melainabacteria bacterium GWF2_32_7]
MRVSNLEKHPEINTNLFYFSSENELRTIIQNAEELIPRGSGCFFEDNALNFNVISTLRFNKILAFNEESGIITCESGVKFSEILNIFVAKGWMLPVIPEVRSITVGEAIAADIYGRNHYKKGSFSNHLISCDVMLGDGSIVTCSKESKPELFWATCGGMGLTGVILRAKFQLLKVETPYIYQESIKARNLEDLFDIFEYSKDFDYSVAWIDCLSKGKNLGRGIVGRVRHATKDDLKNSSLNHKKQYDLPFIFPGLLSQKTYNSLYFHSQLKKKKKFIIPYNTFFYTFDKVDNINKADRKDECIQYQIAFPKELGYAGLKELLDIVNSSNQQPFGSTLIFFGKQDGLLSFPMEGYSLSINFPVNSDLFFLLHELDKLVLRYEGRLNLAKDARMTREVFEKSYPNSEIFKTLKHKFDSNNKFQSLQSKRIGI